MKGFLVGLLFSGATLIGADDPADGWVIIDDIAVPTGLCYIGTSGSYKYECDGTDAIDMSMWDGQGCSGSADDSATDVDNVEFDCSEGNIGYAAVEIRIDLTGTCDYDVGDTYIATGVCHDNGIEDTYVMLSIIYHLLFFILYSLFVLFIVCVLCFVFCIYIY